MEYRTLGRTGERIPTIGLGTWRIGNYSSSDERDSQVKALKEGIELGMNLIDTAEMYHGGRSEEVVRDAVKGIRDQVFIATKVSPDHLAHDAVLAACEGSLRRLGTSHIDLYQVHWPNPAIPIRETMTAMEVLVRAGKVRYVGVSNFSVAQAEEARAALSRIELVSNQVEYSLTNRQAEADILPWCSREKVTLIAYSPLARGRLARPPKEIGQRYHLTDAQVMLNWVTRNEQVIAIPKAVNSGHLRENADSLSTRFTEAEYDLVGKS